MKTNDQIVADDTVSKRGWWCWQRATGTFGVTLAVLILLYELYREISCH